MMRSIILAICLLFGGFVFAQDPVAKLDATLFNDDNGKKLSGVTVEVLQDGMTFITETSASNGRVPIIDLPIGHIYTIKLKKSGFVTKVARVDTRFDYPEDLGEYTPLQFKSSLFSSVEDIDFSFLENSPMIEFEMDAEGILQYDRGKLKDMNRKIEQLRTEMEEKKEELIKEAAEKEKREADFNAYIAAGDAAMKQKDYEKAIGQYELGLGIRPGDAPTEAKIQTAREKLEELNNEAQLEEDYQAKMNAGKAAYDNKELEKALKLYVEASALKPSEQPPKTMIDDIERELKEKAERENALVEFEKLVAEAEAKVKLREWNEAKAKYEEALVAKPGDWDVTQKIASLDGELKTEAEYDKLFAQANKLFEEESYEEAKAKYKQALLVRVYKEEPKTQIGIINEILAKKEAEELAAKEAETQAEYQKQVSEGDAAMASKDFEKAVESFKEALVQKPGDSGAQAKLDAANEAITEKSRLAEEQAQFDKLVAAAEAAFAEKDYEKAKNDYNGALGVKEDAEVKKRIADLDKLMEEEAAATALEDQYNALIQEADQLFDAKENQAAIDKYKEAEAIKEAEYAKSRIVELEKRVADAAAEKEQNENYQAVMDAAKVLFDAQKYEEAKAKYNEALGIKSAEEEPKNKIAAIDTLMKEAADAEQVEAEYQRLMEEGDAANGVKEYQKALDNYNAALAQKPGDTAAQSKIDAANKAIEEAQNLANQEAEFNAYLASAQAAFDQKDYSKAKEDYNNALAIRDAEEVKQKIIEIDKLVEEEMAAADLQGKYDALIGEADKLFEEEDNQAALDKYKEALSLKEEEYPKTRISELEDRLATNAAAQKTNEDYNAAMSDAKSLFDEKKYTDAKSKYEEAILLKPEEQEPKNQITLIEGLIADAANAEKAEAEYTRLMSEGNAAKEQEDFTTALDRFKGALDQKPGDETATAKIEEINNAIEAENQLAEEQANFDAFVAAGETAFGESDYDKAKLNYNNALEIKEDADIRSKIEEINALLAESQSAADLQAKYDAAITEADGLYDANDDKAALDKYKEALSLKEEAHPKSRIDELQERIGNAEAAQKLNEDFAKLMEEGQAAFDSEEYIAAKGKYEKAIALKDEQAPKDKITEIEKLLADLAAAKGAEELDKEYAKYLADGDEAKEIKEYLTAIDNYKKALGVKPTEVEPQEKIDAINEILENQKGEAELQEKFDDFVASGKEAFNAEDYVDAKSNYERALDLIEDAEVKEKIAEIDRLIAEGENSAAQQEAYDAVIKLADEAYAANEYKTALDKYKEALTIKEENHPKERISEIEEKFAGEEAEAGKEKAFNELVALGNEAFDAEDYQKALDKYNGALEIKTDPMVAQKVVEIGIILRDASQNKETRENYEAKVKEADEARDDENWNGAIALYEEALDILAEEEYPVAEIEKVKVLMAAESSSEAEQIYQKIIQKADALFGEEKYDDAKDYYERALRTKSTDAHAIQRLEDIERLKKEQADALMEQAKLDEQYDALIKAGEAAADASDWQAGLDKFKEALNVKPNESYPQNRIAEIETKMGAAALAKQKQAEYQAKINQADGLFDSENYQDAIGAYKEALVIKPEESYPKEKITSAESFLNLVNDNSAEEDYVDLLARAQEKFEDNAFEKALDLYLEAKTLRPSDPLPIRRIDEINQAILDLNALDKEESKYDGFIKDADYNFEKGNWKDALEAYTNAFNVFNRTYPEEKIKECKKALEDESLGQVNKSYQKIIDKADGYFNQQDYTKALEYYNRALGLKPNDSYPKIQIKAIDAILNPPKTVSKGSNLPDYGNENTSVNSMDIENMLKNAQEQHQFNEQQKITEQGELARDSEQEMADLQADENYATRERTILLNENITESVTKADGVIEESSDAIEVMQVEQRIVDAERTKMNDNDVQIQSQIVTNLEIELEEQDDELDEIREAYLTDVETIHTDVVELTNDQTSDQTDVVFGQKEYVEKYTDDRISKELNSDIPRLNTEIHVEDYNIQLINEKNGNIWDQEDVVMNARDEVDFESAQREIYDSNRDIPRIEGIVPIENDEIDVAVFQVNNENGQYNATIDQKKYAETILNEIEIEKIGDDIPRQEMEEFVEEQTLRLEDVSEELVIDQNNVLFDADSKLEAIEIKLATDDKMRDDERKGYEVEVEKITLAEENYREERTLATEDESHVTIEYLEEGNLDKRDVDLDANENADDLIDNTLDAADDLKEETAEVEVDNRVNLENAEDLVESLKDIKLNEIDEKAKNKLGDQFPEGVTEEIYTINDESGLLVSAIVRRVVVRNQVGNVYEKVQTRYGTVSYSCNGSGITEYDWQDQTEAADLVRN